MPLSIASQLLCRAEAEPAVGETVAQELHYFNSGGLTERYMELLSWFCCRYVAANRGNVY
jgi:hypothetical protein